MKLITPENDLPGISPERFEPPQEAEARRVWELMQEGIIREIFCRADVKNAVLVLECRTPTEA